MRPSRWMACVNRLVEHEQPEVAALRARRRSPRPLRQRDHRRDGDRARGGEPVGRQVLAEVGVGIEDRDDGGGSPRPRLRERRAARRPYARRSRLLLVAVLAAAALAREPVAELRPTSPMDEPAVWKASEMREA